MTALNIARHPLHSPEHTTSVPTQNAEAESCRSAVPNLSSSLTTQFPPTPTPPELKSSAKFPTFPLTTKATNLTPEQFTPISTIISPAPPLPSPQPAPLPMPTTNYQPVAGALGSMAFTGRREVLTGMDRVRQMASLATLAGGIAHHFNNIACGMSTMTELALDTEDPATMKRALRMSAEAANRICYLTQTLLACGCQQGGAPDLSDLTEELLNLAHASESRLTAKGIELVLDLRANRIAAVPRQRFGLVLEHLMRNAEEAFEDQQEYGDSPTLRTKRITITTQSRDEQILLQFTDNAIGIAPENLSQVFDPFFTTKGVQGGGNRSNPGLGLTLALGMTLDLGGHIWADSNPGQQTTIHVLLPIAV